MDEQLRIILIIIVSVAIFGLLVFVFVKNYVRNKINNLVEQEKDKKTLIQVFRSKPNNQEFTEFKEYTALMDNIRNQNIENILDFDWLIFKIAYIISTTTERGQDGNAADC